MAETVRFLFSGDQDRAKALKGFAANQLAILKNHMSFRGLSQLKRQVKFEDGTQVNCISCFGTNIVSVFVPPIAPTPPIIPQPQPKTYPGTPLFVFFVGTRSSNRQFLFAADEFTFQEITESTAKVPTFPARWAVSCKDRLYPQITWIGGHRCANDEADPYNTRLQFLYGFVSLERDDAFYAALHQTEPSFNMRGWSTFVRDPDYAAGNVFRLRWAYNYKIQERTYRYWPNTGKWAATSWRTIFGPTTDKAAYLTNLYNLVFGFIPEAVPETVTTTSFPLWSPGVVDVVNGNPDVLAVSKVLDSEIATSGTRGYAPPWTYAYNNNTEIAYSSSMGSFSLEVEDYESVIAETDSMALGAVVMGMSAEDGWYYCTRTDSINQTIDGTTLSYFAPWDYSAEYLVPVPIIGKLLNQAAISSLTVKGYPNMCSLDRDTGLYSFYNGLGSNYTGSAAGQYVGTYDKTVQIPGINIPASLTIARETSRYNAVTDWTSTYNDHGGAATRDDDSVDTSIAELNALKRLSLAKAGRATLIFTQNEHKNVPINNTTGRTTQVTEARHNHFFLLDESAERPTWQDVSSEIIAAFRRQAGIALPIDDTFLGVLTYPTPGAPTNG